MANAQEWVPQVPDIEDLKRNINGFVEQANTEASEHTQRVVSEACKKGSLQSSRTPIAIFNEIKPIHRNCIKEAMQFIPSFQQRSGLDFVVICNEVRTILNKNIEEHLKCILRSGPAPATNNEANTWLHAQVDDAFKNLEVGYIGGKPITMSLADTIQAKAFRLLELLYEKSSPQPLMLDEMKNATNLSVADIQNAWRYLRDKSLINTFSIPYSAQINGVGVDAVEAARLQPNKQTETFPGIKYGDIHIQAGAGSSVIVGNPNSRISTNFLNNPAKIQELSLVLEKVEALLEKEKIDTENLEDIKLDINSIRLQLRRKHPTQSIIQDSFESLKSSLGTIKETGEWVVLLHEITKLLGG